MTTSLPYGYPQAPQAFPTGPVVDPGVDARAAARAEDEDSALWTSIYATGGGVVATLALLAYFAVKNDEDHNRLRDEVGGVDGRLHDYQVRHAEEHQAIAQRQAQVDGQLQSQINVLGNVLNPYGLSRSMIEPTLPMDVRSRFRELNPASMSVARTVYAEPTAIAFAPAPSAVFPSTPVPAVASSTPLALVTQPLGSRVSYAPSMPFASRRATMLPSHIESAVTQVMPVLVPEPELVEEEPPTVPMPVPVMSVPVPVTVPSYRVSTAPRTRPFGSAPAPSRTSRTPTAR